MSFAASSVLSMLSAGCRHCKLGFRVTTEERFERIEGGIRDLIVVSRTVLNSIQQLGGSVGQLSGSVGVLGGSIGGLRDAIGELREAQKHTDENLNALIQAQMETEQKVSRLSDLIDKLVRLRGPNGQSSK